MPRSKWVDCIVCELYLTKLFKNTHTQPSEEPRSSSIRFIYLQSKGDPESQKGHGLGDQTNLGASESQLSPGNCEILTLYEFCLVYSDGT